MSTTTDKQPNKRTENKQHKDKETTANDSPQEPSSQSEGEKIIIDTTPVIDDRDKHQLQFAYTLWFNRRVQGARSQESYEKNIKKVGSFSTVEDFWDYYVHLVRPNDLPNTSDYHLFKDGIKPMWEDDANKCGGKWILRLRKGFASRYWEDLVLAVIGEQFEVGDEICGAVISIRYQEDILSLWTRTATDAETRTKIMETMRRVLNLNSQVQLEYKNHDASIRDNSSFRNTEPIVVAYGERAERGDRPERRERYDRDRGERGERGDRGDRGDRDRDRERVDRGDRPERGERVERGDRPERGDRERSDRSDRSDRERGGEREGGRDNRDIRDTRERGGDRDRERVDRVDRGDRDRSDRSDRYERFDRDRDALRSSRDKDVDPPDREKDREKDRERGERGDRRERGDKGERTDKGEKSSGGDNRIEKGRINVHTK